MDELKVFKVGDRVYWYSQANHNVAGKKAIVMAEVPADEEAERYKPPGYTWEKLGQGGKRKEVSYIVSARPLKVQRPLTKYLKKMTPEQEANPDFTPPEKTYDQWKADLEAMKKAKSAKPKVELTSV